MVCELDALSHREAKRSIVAAYSEGWLETDDSTLPKPNLPVLLDSGETDAIALALKKNADLLLMDEKRGREAARFLGLKVAGVLGELLHARQIGRITNLRNELVRLRLEAGFFIDSKLEEFILSQVGE